MSQYLSIAAQNAYNYDVSRNDQMPWQVQGAFNKGRDTAILDMPILAYLKRYETDPSALIDLYRRISDYMMLNPHPLFGYNNPNHPDLYKVRDGKLKPKDYEAIMRLFGDESPVPLKDNHFFHGAEKTLISQILAQPFRYEAKNINTEFARQSILEDSKKGAKMGIQALLQSMVANGDGGVAPLINPNVKLPKTSDDWLSFATGQEQVEGIIRKLLQHIDFNHDFQNLARQAAKHKFAVNAEFAMVDVVNGEVKPKVLHPSQVRWMAGKPVETLTDPAVFGVQVDEYMTPTELVNTFGVGRLSTGTGIKGVLRYIEALSDKNRINRIGYDPTQNYWSTDGISADMGYYCFDDREREYTRTQVNWMNQLFYPYRGNGKLLTLILVQRNFFLMQREKRFSVELIKGQTRRAATDRELKAWQENRSAIDYDIDFTPVSKETPNWANIKSYARPELWQFTRIGHDGFIDGGPYRYQPDFDEDTQERPRISWPVVGQISYEKSMVLLGENDAQRANVLMQKVDMLLASLGYEDALIIDDVHGKEPISYRYNAKMTGLIRVDSTKYSPGNPAGMMHLKTVKLSNETEQLKFLMGLVRDFTLGFELRTGAGPDVQGQTSEYASGKQQQLNIANQQRLNVEFNWEHSKFMNQLLQVCADVSKFHYAKDGQVMVILSKREREVLELTYKLRLADFAIYLESGQVLAKRKELLDQLVGQLMQSGGIDQAEALMQIIMSDNPAEGIAQYRKIKNELSEVAQQSQQIEQQNQQALLADKQAQRDHEILLKQMDINKDLRVAAMKMGSERAAEDFKGVMADIQNATSREEMILQSQLQQQQAAQQAAIDQQAQQGQTQT